jgi:TonB family protein
MVVGAVVRLSGLAAGLWKLRGYRSSSRPLNPLPAAVNEAFALTDTFCRVAVSGEAHSPATFGLFRPVILLPEKFVALPHEAQLAILCHELLHVRREDWVAALMEEFCGALLWFQPAAYLLIADIRLAREQVVDRQVVELTGAKTPYVEALMAVAGDTLGAAISMAPAFLYRKNLKSRVTFLLEELYMSKTKMMFANVSLAALLGVAGWVSAVSFPLVAQEKAQDKSETKQAAAQSWDFAKVFPEASGMRIRIGGNVLAANLISQVKPPYPTDARSARIQGTVKLGVLVGTDGHISDIVLISGHPLLVQSSVDAVRQWVYRPTLLNGDHVEVISVVDVNYTLSQ